MSLSANGTGAAAGKFFRIIYNTVRVDWDRWGRFRWTGRSGWMEYILMDMWDWLDGVVLVWGGWRA